MTIDAVALMEDPKEQRLSGKKGNEVDACKAAFWGHKEIGFFMGTFSDGFFDTLHGHFRCAVFFHLEPFPAEHNKARSKYEEKNKDFFKLKDKEKLSLIKDYFNHDYVKVNPNNPIPYFMGIDCGLVNFAAICIFNQYRDLNYVVSGRTLKNKIIKIDTKLDQKKSNLTTEEIKIIQSKKDKNQQLTRVELTQLKQFHKDLSIDPILIEFQLRKANITNDFLHKLSKGLIQDCLNKEIKVIIVGKNKGQKNEINLGSKNNRAMYNFPHARFIEILKYKAMLNDILVVETEESYTSKTSFIDNEDLAEYKKTTQGMKSQLSGKRIHQVFITKNKIKLHADINGSFNIVRKVLKSFQYDKEKMSLSYNLVELNLQGKNKFYAFCGPLAKSNSGFYPL